MGFVVAALRKSKGQCKLQLFQLMVLLGKGDGRSMARDRFHGFTLLSSHSDTRFSNSGPLEHALEHDDFTTECS